MHGRASELGETEGSFGSSGTRMPIGLTAVERDLVTSWRKDRGGQANGTWCLGR